MDPPACIQNAMMTKDKKPFTYTPGGIDLSEVRSPRMARRIERNSHLGGVDDVSRPQQTQPANYANLPPSTLAAMRPQPQVQVFPSGPPPPAPFKGGMVPPPPPPMNMPPPPPPPSEPLPTQKVRTSDNQTLERPDMTKIIPENPMAMLRKTGGPAPRKSLVDEMFEHVEKPSAATQSPPISSQYPQNQSRFQQSPNERGPQIPPVPEQNSNQFGNRPQVQHPQQLQGYSVETQNIEPKYQTPVIERKPLQQQSFNGANDVKPRSAVGHLYIPPVNQQEKKVVSPPSPPERSPNSPQLQTPPLREAPRPWQTKKPQSEEQPPWARKENENASEEKQNYQTPSPLSQQPQNQQPRWPQSRPTQQTVQQQQKTQYQPQPQYSQQPQKQQQYTTQPQYSPEVQYTPQPQYRDQQPIGVRIEIRSRPQSYIDTEPEERKPNAVYVTQPLVLQHPGPGQPPRTQVVDNQGAIYIPLQMEGSNPKSPSTPRSLNRQQSWGNNPTQSNAFRVIQKITQTEDDDEYDDTPVTQHSPRYPQNFQQPTEQMRRMKIQENDKNKFKQGLGEPQSENKQPKVRTIPIQLEDDGPPKYVHPSEQTVPEPKKYTGSAIPSRSFKILQAMTAAPDNCANANEQYEAPIYEQWAYPPYPYSPYWPHPYYNYYHPESNEEYQDDSRQTEKPKKHFTGRLTPVPVFIPTPVPQKIKKHTSEDESDSNTSLRSTPLPFWNHEYCYPYESGTTDKSKESNSYPYLPPYFDPYYYYYYYGYPPMYPPHYYYGSSEDCTGYSSAEELNMFKRNSNTSPKRSDANKSRAEVPIDLNEKVNENRIVSELEETNRAYSTNPLAKLPSLKSIKSVTDMKIYEIQNNLENDEHLEECSDYTTEDTDEETSVYAEEEEDEYPHQLSVIMEESERTESRLRCESVLSNTSTLSGRTGVEYDEPLIAVMNKPQKDEIDNQKEEFLNPPQKEEITASFTLRSPRLTPKIFSRDCSKSSDIEDEDITEHLENEPNEGLQSTEVSNLIDTKEAEEDDDKKSDESEDWWGIIGKEDDDLPRVRKTTIYERTDKAVEEVDVLRAEDSKQNLCDTYDHIQTQVEETMEQPTAVDVLGVEDNCGEKIDDNSDPSQRSVEEVIKLEAYSEEPQENKRSSVYDLEDEIDLEEITSGGKLLEMDSFVEQLEKIKRNSGLWSLEKFESYSKTYAEDDPEKVDKAICRTQDKTISNSRTTDISEFVQNPEIKHQNEDKSTNTPDTLSIESKVDRKATETKSSSTDYSEYSGSESLQVSVNQNKNKMNILNEKYDSSTDTDCSDSESSSSDDEPVNIYNSINNSEKREKPLSIKDRIAALKSSIKQKQHKMVDEEIKTSVKERISAIETNTQSHSKTTSTKSSLKSFDDYSEEDEEVDSGVTSDISRHISDNEEFPELKKLSRYQRAATHSRLFKLLQEECENEDNYDENVRAKEALTRESLDLPLTKFLDTDSSFSSGKSSPNHMVNEKLVSELVQSLLKRKKGQIFKTMPKEKLYTAAAKVLQEEIDNLETPSDYGSFLSPLRNSTGCSTAAETPQEFTNIYDEYKQYYDTWKEVDNDKNLNYKTGLLTRGPKTLSAKHIHKKIMKLLDSPETTPPLTKKPLDSNEVTTAS